MVYFKILFRVLKEEGRHGYVFSSALPPAGDWRRDLYRDRDRGSSSFESSSPQLTDIARRAIMSGDSLCLKELWLPMMNHEKPLMPWRRPSNLLRLLEHI